MTGRSAGIHRDASATSSGGFPHRVIQLVGLEAGHLPNKSAAQGAIGNVIAERASCGRKVAGHAVIVARRKRKITVSVHDALLVHDGFALCDVIKARSGSGALHKERSLQRCDIHHRHVDVRRQALFCGVIQAAFLQRIAQFQGGHAPWNRLLDANGRWHRKLRVIIKIGRHIRAIIGHGDVWLRAPNDVIGPLHLRRIGVVDADIARKHKRILEARKQLVESYALFL